MEERVKATEDVLSDVAQQAFKRIDEIAETQEEHSGALVTLQALVEYQGRVQRQMQRQLNRMETRLTSIEERLTGEITGVKATLQQIVEMLKRQEEK